MTLFQVQLETQIKEPFFWESHHDHSEKRTAEEIKRPKRHNYEALWKTLLVLPVKSQYRYFLEDKWLHDLWSVFATIQLSRTFHKFCLRLT